MSDAPLSILLAGDYPADPTLGSAKVFYKLREEFAALGHHCDVLFADAIGGPPSRQLRQAVVPYLAGAAIARQARRHRYDVFDVASAEGLTLGLRRRAGGLRGSVYICRSNGLESCNYQRMLDDAAAGLTAKPWTRRIWYPASRLSQVAAAARLADRLLVLNDNDRRFAQSRGWQSADRIDVIGHGVSEGLLGGPAAPAARGRGLLFCGSWDHVKGLAYLTDAFARIRSAGTEVPLTVLGPGVPAERVLQDFPEAVRRFVTVVPRVPEADVIELFRSHDLLLWTSTYEGFGLVLLEAMSQGLPVVTTPVGCAPSIVRSGVDGLFVPPRDGAAVAAAAVALMNDPQRRKALGEAARARVQGLTWRATAERTVAAYRKALEEVA